MSKSLENGASVRDGEDDKKNVDDECVQNRIVIIGEKAVTGRNAEN